MVGDGKHEHKWRDMSSVTWGELWDKQEKRLPLAQKWWWMAGGHAGAHVADMGCGPGRISLAYAEWAGERGSVLAVDASAEALSFLESKRDHARHARVRTLQLDAQDSPLPSERYDAVFVTDVLHHVERPGALLRNLRPARATLLVSEFDPNAPGDIGPPLDARVQPKSLVEWLTEASWTADEPVFHPRFEHYSVVARAR